MQQTFVLAVACAAGISILPACGSSEEKVSDRARLDIHGTVGSARIDLTNADVPFRRNGVDDSMISFEVLDEKEERIISVDLAGRFPVGTQVIGEDYGDEWDSSIAGASVDYYEGDKRWAAWSSKYSEWSSPITFTVKTSNDHELAGVITADMVPAEGTTVEAQARLEVRIHGFGKGQNVYGGSSGGSSGGSVCFANKPFTDDFGKGTLCTQAPCAKTSGSTQNFKPGTCSTSKVKYGCCDIPDGLTVYAYEPCTTGNCESLADWKKTCDQLGGTGRAGVCP